MHDSGRKSFQYRADIDGLRAIAVLLVMLFHFHLGFTGGFIGVDVFFVISGYVIMRSVGPAFARGAFSFQDFWIRRIRRLYPAHLVMLLSTLAVGAWVLAPQDLSELAECALVQPIAGANFYLWAESGYWAPAAEELPLLHTWSLAVEEQFYLLFALILSRLHRQRTARNTLLLIIVGSFLWNLVCTSRFPTTAFFLLPTRMWEFGLGILLGAVHQQRLQSLSLSQRFSSLFALTGIGLIVGPSLLYGKSTTFPGWAAVPPCVGTLLLIQAHHNGSASVISRLLTWQPLVFTGKISYSLYLWHWPVFVFANYCLMGGLSTIARLLLMAVSWCLAYLTFNFVETPCRKGQLFPSPQRFLAVAGGVTAGLLAFAVVLKANDGFPSRFPQSNKLLAAPTAGRVYVPRFDEVPSIDQLPLVGDTTIDAPARILLWGDSHAGALIPAFDSLGKEAKVAVYVAHKPGVAPVVGAWPFLRGPEDASRNPAIMQFVKERRIRHVVLAARWSFYCCGIDDGDHSHLLCDESVWLPSIESSSQLLGRKLGEVCRELNAAGSTVWIVQQVPFQSHFTRSILFRLAAAGRDLNSLATPLSEHKVRSEAVNRLLDAIDASDVRIIDPTPKFLDGQFRCVMAAHGTPLYKDEDHVSPAGAKRLASLFTPIFDRRSLAESPPTPPLGTRQASGQLRRVQR